ncbi:MAG: sugar O-acetyltransferase [Planctomycetaceae bacterium]
MNGEWDKMLTGKLYDPLDPHLSAARRRARERIRRFNASREDDRVGRAHILAELFGAMGEGVWIEPPFFCDYGRNITLGRRVYFNFNCVVLDPAPVRIGDGVLFGPAVQIYTATHPLSTAERRTGLEFAKPVEVGSDVWIGGGAILCPGVTIGAGTVIGAGSVVTRDVPSGVLAAGNPCRVLRELTD